MVQNRAGTMSGRSFGHRSNDWRDGLTIFTDSMQTAAAGAGKTVWLDHLFDAWQVLGQRPAISSTRPGGAFDGPILGMNDRRGGFQILQRQFELARIALLRPPPEGCLPEGRDQLALPRQRPPRGPSPHAVAPLHSQ